MKRLTFIRTLSSILSAIVIIALFVVYLLFKQNIVLPALITTVFVSLLLFIFFSFEVINHENNAEISKNLDSSFKELLKQGNIGLLSYNEDYEITWMSEYFEVRNIYHVGEKILSWIGEVQELLIGDVDYQLVSIGEEKYSIRKIDNINVLVFENITENYNLNKKVEDNSYVLGLLSFDNLDEATQSEENLSLFNTEIKNPVNDYFRSFKVAYKTLNNKRMYLIMNKAIYENIFNDHFSILSKVRNVSKDFDLDITLSIAFVSGSEDLNELDETLLTLLDLAETRGGDQVVVRKIGHETNFYGGYSEAREKLSKTRVRSIVNSLRDLVKRSSNVIIVGHKDMDADCVGAALNMSNFARSMDKDVYVVTKSGGVESMINEVLNLYDKELKARHNFINEVEALNYLNDDSLVIMVDHHSKMTSNSPTLLTNAKRIVIIDHHRRSANLDVNCLLVYIEPAASSSVELTSEFLPLLSRKTNITSEEANIMYLGLLIDTNSFRVRTGSRTFDVLKMLRQNGADPLLCDRYLEEPYDVVLQRSNIINSGKLYYGNILISASTNNIPRSIASQATDAMLKAKEIEAAFVVCQNEKDGVVITCRSKGKVNVQVIAESLGGGGHMTAAGVQLKDSTVSKAEAELIGAIKKHLEDKAD